MSESFTYRHIELAKKLVCGLINDEQFILKWSKTTYASNFAPSVGCSYKRL